MKPNKIRITASNAKFLGMHLARHIKAMGYTHLSQIRFVRQPMRVGGLWECEVAV